jgi:ferrochelatase
VTETARLCAELAGIKSWRLVWQSRSGPPSSPWLGPDVCEVIGTSTARSIVVAPIGFVCDNMEIVHDLDVEAAAVAREQGARLWRAPTVTTSPGFVSMVRQLVEERLGPGAERAALGQDGPWPDECPVGHCPL